MTETLYHMLLRTTALTSALVLLFVSGVLSPLTRELSRNTTDYVATAIGVNASVTPTEINTLSAQLEARSQELESREIAVSLKEATTREDLSTSILSVAVFVLLVLMVLNYTLDFLRARDMRGVYTKAV